MQVEEAKDVRELKSLLSGLTLQDPAKPALHHRETSAADSAAQKIALLKSVSAFLFSLSLFLALLLVFLLVRVYLIHPAYNDKQRTVVQSPVLENAPAAVAPHREVTDIPPLPLPEVKETLINEPVSARNEVLPAETEAPPAVELERGGGSLYFIALKHYGKADETIFDLIVQANPDIVDVRKIADRQPIILPEITPSSYVRGNAQDGYSVHVGTFETLQWAEIYAARLRSHEKRISIEPKKFSTQDTWYRVTIGTYDTSEEALQTVSGLIKNGLIALPSRSEQMHPNVAGVKNCEG